MNRTINEIKIRNEVSIELCMRTYGASKQELAHVLLLVTQLSKDLQLNAFKSFRNAFVLAPPNYQFVFISFLINKI